MTTSADWRRTDIHRSDPIGLSYEAENGSVGIEARDEGPLGRKILLAT
jgi:hypothetical protein